MFDLEALIQDHGTYTPGVIESRLYQKIVELEVIKLLYIKLYVYYLYLILIYFIYLMKEITK